MPPVRPKLERIDLARADDPRDVIHRAVACLAQGGVVGLPTDTSYSVSASALRADAVARLVELCRCDGPAAACLLLKGAAEVPDWIPDLTPLGARLARRSWPGPVTFLFRDGTDRGLSRRLPPPVRAAVAADDAIGLRCPDRDVVLDILHLLVGPLVLADAAEAAGSADMLATIDGIDLVLDEGPIPAPASPTLVRVEAEHWGVLRPGPVAPAELARRAGLLLLFVCTGNTCRSPMAEALCKALLARRLGCAPDELEGRGYTVLSAGVAAMDGMPAASHALDVVRAWGGSLDQHRSREVTPELVREADLILTMTADHRELILADFPEAARRVRPLHTHGGDIPDPVGCDRDTYQRTADSIAQHLQVLLDGLGIPDG